MAILYCPLLYNNSVMTLSQTAVLTKQAITVSIITIIVSLVSFIGYKIWYAYYLAHLPPVEEKPDLKFGQLPYPDFPQALVSTSNFTYSIDTSTGNLPKIGIDTGFEKVIKVYFVTKSYASLLSGEKSKILAEKFDIKNPPQILSETNYLFKDNEKTLNVNLDSGNFVYKNNASISGKESLDDDIKLITDFESKLALLGAFPEDLRTGRKHVLKINNNNSEIGQISLWPPSINNTPVLTSQFEISDISAQVYKNADDFKNYLSLDYFYYPIDLSTFATYPTKSAEKAFEDLKNGKAVTILEPAKPSVSITSIYLAYFLSKNYTPYLIPIFVFEGPHFIAYTSAISEEYHSLTK